jgi:hypothetical protein
MANPDHLSRLKDGPEPWNQWRRDHPALVPDLSGADLRQADLDGIILGAAHLAGADLARANLSWSLLQTADFRNANLQGAFLCASRLYKVNFTGADLTGADFTWALIDETIFSDATLKGAKGLDQCQYFEPAVIDDRTLAKSGRKLHEQIGEAIRVSERVLLILSQASMASEWVKTEIAEARQIEINERRPVLFPISLVPYAALRAWKNFDADTGKDSAREIREYFIPDFSIWKDDALYQAALERLLHALDAASSR